MTTLEILGLLNLLAVVVFGVIQALKKEPAPEIAGTGIFFDSKSQEGSPRTCYQQVAPLAHYDTTSSAFRQAQFRPGFRTKMPARNNME